MTSNSTTNHESQNWFYSLGQNVIGPISFSELQHLNDSGQLGPNVQIVEEGGQDWRPIGDVLPSLPATQMKKEPQISTARQVTGCGCLSLLMLMGIFAMLAPSPEEKNAATPVMAPAVKDASKDKPLEYKLACIDAGHFLPDNAPILEEYRRVLFELSTRFETTPERIGDMTGAVVNRIREKNGIESTMLEMMHGVEKASSNGLHELMGKGPGGYSSTLSALAILMIDAKNK